MAGASAVQVGTATFLNPQAPLDVIEGLEEFMRREGIEDIREVIGAALPSPPESETADAGRVPAQRLRSRI